MDCQIWKYTIKPNDLIHDIPANAKFLCVDEQFGEICAWFEVVPDNPNVTHHFEVYGTGHRIKYDRGGDRKYLGTVKLEGGALIFHVFEYIGA